MTFSEDVMWRDKQAEEGAQADRLRRIRSVIASPDRGESDIDGIPGAPDRPYGLRNQGDAAKPVRKGLAQTSGVLETIKAVFILAVVIAGALFGVYGLSLYKGGGNGDDPPTYGSDTYPTNEPSINWGGSSE